MGLRCGLVKTELKEVRKAYDAQAPITKVAKHFRVKPQVIKKCYKHFKEQDDAQKDAQKTDVDDNDDL